MTSRFAAAPLASPAKAKGVPPHRLRALGARVLVVDDTRRFAVLSREEYEAWLRGKAAASVHERLAAAGFGSADAEGLGAASLAGWRGPRRHVLLVQQGAARMTADTARAALDFAFSSPSPGLVVELACDGADDVWPVLRFCVDYAQRRAEWGRRRLSLVARARRRASPAALEWLKARGVERRAVVSLDGRPPKAWLPEFEAQTALALVGAPAAAAAAWLDALGRAGLRSVLLAPASEDAAAARAFLPFYAAALERLAEEECPLVEEGLRALLAEPRWALPGLDLLEELCCAPDGSLYTSDRAAGLPPSGAELFRLGKAGETRLRDLAGHPAARAALAAAESEARPLCRTCAYAPFCAVPASQSFQAQGTIWGLMPDSPACVSNMGRLDAVFAFKSHQKMMDLLAKHGVDTSSQSC